jgi:hypothetical protein
MAFSNANAKSARAARRSKNAPISMGFRRLNYLVAIGGIISLRPFAHVLKF